ncbi:unnamed protein product [Agarophyton chilense]|eukprot:gb/GEZJ01001846.1/.p1 GENE.gb/GEZJ01001846.1/~~gb/GEZJ01001846.1/.p1  ORF type:complete len:344 (-),score=107.66 gb/GEZJ01001846.1/:536-1567(-)
MASEKNSEVEIKDYFEEEDERWMRQVLDLIPRSIYGVVKTVNEKVKKSSKENAPVKKKTSKPKKKNRRRKKEERLKPDITNEREERKQLKQKLQQKILEKRSERKADDEGCTEMRNERKRKREESKADKAKKRKKEQKNKTKEIKLTKSGEDKNRPLPSSEKDLAEGANVEKQNSSDPSLETTRLSGFASDEDKLRRSKRRKITHKKLVDLQKQLEAATKDKEEKVLLNKRDKDQSKSGSTGKLNSLTDKDVSDKVKEKEIEKALQRVRGDSVKDDVGKIRKSIRKEKRKHEKSKEDWTKRVKAVEDEKRLRQERRENNLKKRKENRTGSKKKKSMKHGRKKG